MQIRAVDGDEDGLICRDFHAAMPNAVRQPGDSQKSEDAAKQRMSGVSHGDLPVTGFHPQRGIA